MNYCTLDEVKAELSIPNEDYDGLFQSAIEAAKEFIDKLCDRHFDAVSEIRYFDSIGSLLFIDDLISLTGETDGIFLDKNGDGIYESEMAPTDYILYPLNTLPKTLIKISNDSNYGGFASGIKRGVKIIGTWGYASSIPEPIRRASIIQVCRWFKRKDTAFQDIVGSPETGQFMVYKGLDPDVKLIVEQYRRIRI